MDEELLTAQWAYEDAINLYHFSHNTLGFDKLVVQPHYDLCDFITNSGKYEGKLKNKWKLILLPRGTYKTTIACVAYPLWLLIRDPNIRVLIDSETYAKSVATLRAIKGIITTNDLFQKLHGNLSDPISREAINAVKANKYLTWNEDEIIIGSRTNFSVKESSITVGGVDVVKVGMHYDVVIADDLHSEKNVTTKEQIEKVIQHVQLMSSILEPGGTFILIGTRWDDKDCYGWILDDVEGFRIDKPGIYSGQSFDAMVYPWRVGEPEPGEELVENIYKKCWYFAPTILNENSIKDIRRLYVGNAYLFSCQYNNDPIDDDSAILKESWIKEHVISQKLWTTLRDESLIFMSVDPAIGEGTEHDYSAIVAEAFVCPINPDTGKQIFMRILLDSHYGRWNPEALVEEIIKSYRVWRPQIVGFESVAAFEAYKAIFRERTQRRNIHLPMHYFKRDTRVSKDSRIRALAPIFEGGTFYTIKGARGIEEFWDEYRRFPRAKHDDVLDALADIEQFAYFPTWERGGLNPTYQPLDEITGY